MYFELSFVKRGWFLKANNNKIEITLFLSPLISTCDIFP